MQLSAQLAVSQSLVAHLNAHFKSAVEKADDGDALAGEVLRQLQEARADLGTVAAEKVRGVTGGGGGAQNRAGANGDTGGWGK